ncbi:KLTH0B00396p [Lachancea thermotolerans CBS 6340]|uniref:KLTH0B00396p n=1 Tax=Lachancea thermotolerans (strain ATCC 56472 / CBS 6340 / NRRL Y-8284) TaxID=559295 RepID=C5DC66_LACTC|nr:KLTH0B00396p [Lachancea thermotolerans CBS 6340]CAR21376.1 KLTH0B00396p [Lachancea thermotolerans CBS 6340]
MMQFATETEKLRSTVAFLYSFLVPLSGGSFVLLGWDLLRLYWASQRNACGYEAPEADASTSLISRKPEHQITEHASSYPQLEWRVLCESSQQDCEQVVKKVFGKELLKSYAELLTIILCIVLELSLQRAVNRTQEEAPWILSSQIFWFSLLVSSLCRIVSLHRGGKSFITFQKLRALNFLLFGFIFCVKVLHFTLVFLRSQVKSLEGKYVTGGTFLAGVLSILALSSQQSFGLTDPPLNQNDAPPAPEGSSSIFHSLTFSWLDGLIFRRSQKQLRFQDIFDLQPKYRTLPVIKRYSDRSHGCTSLIKRLTAFCWKSIIMQCTWSLAGAIASFMPTLQMKKILEYIENPSGSNIRVAWVCVFVMIVSKIIAALCESQAVYLGARVCFQLKSIITAEISRKALKQSLFSSESKTRCGATNGEVINLVAIDSTAVSELCGSLHYLVQAGIMTTVAISLLYQMLGWSAFVGVSVIIILLPFNVKIATLMQTYQSEALAMTDKKTNAISAMLGSIKNVKFLCWENHFQELIMGFRSSECSFLTKKLFCWATLHLVWFLTPTLVTAATFGASIYLQKQKITVASAYTALTLFALLRNPLTQLATMLGTIIQTTVSIQRIEKFLNRSNTKKHEILKDSFTEMGFRNASLTWNRFDTGFMLKNLTIDFELHKLNVIIGPSGSGKSSVLLALLGELDLIEGSIRVPRGYMHDDRCSFAFCSQTPWITNATVKENIVFSSQFNTKRYQEVLHACGLEEDILEMQEGDETVVGDKGMTLSGGQRQRLALARAVYSGAEHLLLDDCLSAVDPGMAVWIFQKCIMGPLMKGKTCILATHNIALVQKHADMIILLDNGRVSKIGKARDFNFDSEFDYSKPSKLEKAEMKPNKKPKKEMILQPDTGFSREEHKEDGSIKIEVYNWLVKHLGGWRTITAFTMLLCLTHGIEMTQNLWIKIWCSSGDGANEHYKSSIYYLSTYAAIGLFHASVTTLIMLKFLCIGLEASSKVFAEILNRVLHAKMTFFDFTPAGRILNRITRDFEILEQELMVLLLQLLFAITSLGAILLLISVIATKFLIFAFLLGIIYAVMITSYIPAFRDLKRYEGITRSPIFEQFSELLSGFVTIRGFGKEKSCMGQLFRKLDLNNRPAYYVSVVQLWLCLRVEVLGSLVLGATATLSLLNAKELGAGLAGLALTYAMPFSQSALWTATVSSNVEIKMTSVERIKEYTEIDCEDTKAGALINTQWSGGAEISFDHVYVRYAPHLPDVLKNVSFTLLPNSKVAIVGRTGSGKSTVMMSLFRLIELTNGTIRIGGIDIASLNLQTLRRELTVIPQDPSLFSGTIKSNIDPFGRYSDQELTHFARRIGLFSGTDDVRTFNSLGSLVSEGGENMSQGQRQLLCLARALLQKSKILILDEATASIDHETDATIQQVVRDFSSGGIVITVAHRMSTIIDYDQVIVLDSGIVKENNHPYLLLKQNGAFHQMCKESGEYERLEDAAKKAYQKGLSQARSAPRNSESKC